MYLCKYRSGFLDGKWFFIGLLEVLLIFHVLLFLYLLLSVPCQLHLVDWLLFFYLLIDVLVLVLF
jgi:hypothetical protein